MGGLGALLAYLGGVGMWRRAGCTPKQSKLSRYTTLYRCGGVIASNRKENALNRIILRVIRTYRTQTENTRHTDAVQQPEDGADA